MEQEVTNYGPRSINSFILFGIRKTCLSSGRSLLLYQYKRMEIELIVVIIEAHHCYGLDATFYQISFPQG
jgi:hypothetical protein